MHQENHEVEETEVATLTPELVVDLIELLKNPSVEVRHGTISAILQYTPESQDKLKFLNTDLITLLRKWLFEPALTKICLSTLIHFATQSQLLPQYFALVEPLVLKMKEWKQLNLQLSLLLLLNISQQEAIVVQLVSKEQKRGYLVEVLYALLEQNQSLRWILVNIFTNITSFERGRKYMVEDHICPRFVLYILHFEPKLRQGSLKIIRNCAFQWEEESFATQILSKKVQLVDRIGKLSAFLIHKAKLVSDLIHSDSLLRKYFPYQNELAVWQHGFKVQNQQKALTELQLAIDIILVLSNADFKKRGVEADLDSFKELLSLLKFTGIKQETKDKLQALQIFGF